MKIINLLMQELQFLIANKTNQIFYRPVVSYNLYDGILTGITLTNQSPLKKNLTYFISPQYSSKSKSISGLTSLNYRDIINKTNTINYFISISKFSSNSKSTPRFLFK